MQGTGPQAECGAGVLRLRCHKRHSGDLPPAPRRPVAPEHLTVPLGGDRAWVRMPRGRPCVPRHARCVAAYISCTSGHLLGLRWIRVKEAPAGPMREGDPLGRGTRRPTGYLYAQGLDYLRRFSGENAVLTTQLLKDWRAGLSTPRCESLSICDYGSGFGDLMLQLVARFGVMAPLGTSFRIDLVDDDIDLRDYAASTIRRIASVEATPLSSQEFSASMARYDLILASHVFYYIEDRSALLHRLISRLRPGGKISVVLRADDCATFMVRSAIRNATSEATARARQGPARARITATGIENQMKRSLLDVHTAQRTFRLNVPRADVQIADLYSSAPSSEATEFVRLLGHLPTRGSLNPKVVDTLLSELDSRVDGDNFAFRLSDCVVTGSRSI